MYKRQVADTIVGKQFSGIGGHEEFVSGSGLELSDRSLICLPSTALVDSVRHTRLPARLGPVGGDDQGRFGGACHQDVHYVPSVEEARRRGLHLSEEESARKWHGPARVLCVVRFGHLRDFGNPALGLSLPHILAKSPNGKFFLVANRP